MHLYEVLRRPLLTEKTTMLQAKSKFAFEVAGGANKLQVKQAVEQAFDVKVNSVNIMTMPSKNRRVGKRVVSTPSWKKAIVTLRPGDKITIFEGV